MRVDRRTSNTVRFLRPVPFFDALQGQPSWPDLQSEGGQPFYIASVYSLDGVDQSEVSVSIGGRQCTGVTLRTEPDAPAGTCNPAFSLPCIRRIECTTPAGVGSSNEVIISIGTNGASEAASRGNWLVLAYAPPQIDSIHGVFAPIGAQPDSSGPLDFY